MSNNITEIDELDNKIIEIMQANALITNMEVGHKIGLSPSAVNERIRKLKEKNVIKRVSAFINASYIKKQLCAFIYVLVDKPEQSKKFLQNVIKNSDVLECHHVTGEFSYLLKVRVANTKELEEFISKFLKSQQGVVKTLTEIVLSSAKDGATIIE